MIYLDHAATSWQKPEEVVKAVSHAMLRTGNAGRGGHAAALDSSRMVFQVRSKLADFFGADGPEQVAFTANSTESLNLAIQGMFGPGDQVITTACEHNSVLRPLYRQQAQGMVLSILPSDQRGCIDYGLLEDWMGEGARRSQASCLRKAVVCTHASNLTGNLFDIGRIGLLCRRYGYLFIVDASQTAGPFPIDMQKMEIDVLCFTGHKGLMGPQGIGGICVRRGLQIRPLVVGGSGMHSYSREHPAGMPEALEAGTLNGPGIAGLGAAVDFIMKHGQRAVREREQALMRRFYKEVNTIPGVQIYGDFGQGNITGEAAEAEGGCMGRCGLLERAPIVSLNLGSLDSGEVADLLYCNYEIAVRSGAHCAPLMHKALGTEEQGAVRFSFSWFNTEAEVDAAAAALRELADQEL